MKKTSRKNDYIMKYFFILLISLLPLSIFAQKMTYKEWQEEAKSEIRLLPEYGNVEKNLGQIEADQELIKSELKAYGTYRKASDKLVIMGFNNIYNNDLKQAMYRFNQAWLLDPKNENVYWGFGAIYFNFNDYDSAFKQYDKGLLLNPNSSNILTDKATVYTSMFANKQDVIFLDKAIELFNRSYKIDPSNQNTLFKLSAAYFYKKDCANEWRFYDECMKLGGQSISPGYGDALKRQCNR
jgi:tetratricopeptide (TPR) repeat protein